MKHTWGLEHEETTQIKQGSSTYYMRRWLRLHVAQLIMSSYPLPKSSLFPRGINRNTLPTWLMFWKSRKRFQLLMRKKLIKLTTSSKELLSQSPGYKWPWKSLLENRSSSQWARRMSTLSSKTHCFIFQTLTGNSVMPSRKSSLIISEQNLWASLWSQIRYPNHPTWC